MSETGYTTYWYVRADTDPKVLASAGRSMFRVVEATPVPLANARGEPGTEPEYDKNAGEIRFNGVGDDAHQTFVFGPSAAVESDGREYAWRGIEGCSGSWNTYLRYSERMSRQPDLGPGWVFNSCKTAFKPYHPVVVACLLAAQEIVGDSIVITADRSTWAEFIGDDLTTGWQNVNALLGQPTSVGNQETAVELYERVFAASPPVIPAFEQVAA